MNGTDEGLVGNRSTIIARADSSMSAALCEKIGATL